MVSIETWSSLTWLLFELQFCCVPSFAEDGFTVTGGTVENDVSTEVFCVSGVSVEEFLSLRISVGRVCVSRLAGGSSAEGLSSVAVWLDRTFSVERPDWVS